MEPTRKRPLDNQELEEPYIQVKRIKVIDNIPALIHQEIQECCCICQETITGSGSITTCQNKHPVHTLCLKMGQTSKESNLDKCPVCRSSYGFTIGPVGSERPESENTDSESIEYSDESEATLLEETNDLQILISHIEAVNVNRRGRNVILYHIYGNGKDLKIVLPRYHGTKTDSYDNIMLRLDQACSDTDTRLLISHAKAITVGRKNTVYFQ